MPDPPPPDLVRFTKQKVACFSSSGHIVGEGSKLKVHLKVNWDQTVTVDLGIGLVQDLPLVLEELLEDGQGALHRLQPGD